MTALLSPQFAASALQASIPVSAPSVPVDAQALEFRARMLGLNEREIHSAASKIVSDRKQGTRPPTFDQDLEYFISKRPGTFFWTFISFAFFWLIFLWLALRRDSAMPSFYLSAVVPHSLLTAFSTDPPVSKPLD